MDDFVIKQISQAVNKSQSILVAVSKNSAFDGLASGLALFLCLKKLGKNVSICGPSPKVSEAKALYAVDKIGDVTGRKNLVVVIDNAIEKVDKVTHFLQNNRLKLVVHSLPGSTEIAQKDISFEKEAAASQLIISIGYQAQEELKKDITHEQNISPETMIINISRDKARQKFAQLEVVDDESSSLSQLTAKLIMDISLPMDTDCAYNLYTGIAHATQMFSPALCSDSTFEIAKNLIKLGAGKASLANLTRTTSASVIDKVQPEKFYQTPSTNVNFDQVLKSEETQKTQEMVEREDDKESWLKPPKVYHGSKSFDRES